MFEFFRDFTPSPLPPDVKQNRLLFQGENFSFVFNILLFKNKPIQELKMYDHISVTVTVIQLAAFQ